MFQIFQISLSFSAPADAECLSNPMSNPSMCMNQIQRFLNQASEMRIDPVRGMSMGGPVSPRPRKKSMVFEDEADESTSRNDVSVLLEKIRKGVNINNSVSGDNVKFQQDVNQLNNLLRRLAISNNIRGETVNTELNASEVNKKHRSDGISPEQLRQVARRLAIINKLKGIKVNTEQNVAEYNDDPQQRMAMKNDIKGQTVITSQDIKEFNENPVSAFLKILRRLAIKNDIKGIKVNTNQNIAEYNDGTANDIRDTLKRLAVSNKIEGVHVNTKQDVKEFNDNTLSELSRALQRLALKNDIKGETVLTKQNVDEYNDDVVGELADAVTQADKLSRMAVSNKIEGVDVKTVQNVKEINEDSLKAITDRLQRLAVKNDIKGVTVNTDLKADEFNDDTDFGHMMDRLAIVNNIKGHTVNTDQDVKEYNDEQSAALLDSLKRLALSNKISGISVVTNQKVLENNEGMEKSQNDEEDQKRGGEEEADDSITAESEDEMLQKIQSRSENNEAPVEVQDDFVEPQIPPMRNLQDQMNAQIYNDMMKRVAMQNGAMQVGAMQNAAMQNAGMQIGYPSRKYFDELTEADDLVRRTHDADDALSTTDRRMTVNNNLSEARKMAIENKIEGKKVDTSQNVSEVSSSLPVKLVLPGSSVIPRPKKDLSKKSSTVLECKTGDGKTVYEADLKSFTKLLENNKDVTKTS